MPYIPNQSFSYGSPGQLSELRSMTPQQLLDMRTNSQIAQGAPALAENARQFDVGNTGTNERYYAGLTSQEKQALQALNENARQFNVGNEFNYSNLNEKARESDIGTQFNYAQLSSQQLLDQLNAWSRMMAGLQ